MGRRAVPSTTLSAAVRAHFGLTQQELAQFLGVTESFIGHLEAGRSSLPAARYDRLLPLGQGLPPTPATPAPAAPVLPLPEADPLEARLDYCRHHAARLRRQLRPLEQRARYAARWQAALPRLLPTADALTRQWLELRAASLLPAEAAQWHLLRLRAEALEMEVAGLAALLAGRSNG